jgi:hypothetical protein
MSEFYWKKKYDDLCIKIQDLHEIQEFENKEPSNECLCEGDEFWISNDLDVCADENYAIRNWGKGKYFKVKKVINE